MTGFALQIISGVQVGRRLKISGPVTLGRAADNTVCFTGPDGTLVSSHHAVIEQQGDQLTLRDLGSTNGTFVNGERVEDAFLQADQIVSLGQNGPKLRVSLASQLVGDSTTLKPFGQGSMPSGFPAGQTQQRTKLEPPIQSQPTSKRPVNFPLFPSEGDAGNYTMGLAQRIRNDEADQQEMRDVIKDKKRAERLARSGMLSKKEALMIQSAAHSYSSHKRQALIILLSVIAVALCVTGFLAWQNMGYRGQIKKQQVLMANVKDMENQLAAFQAAGDNPEIDHEKEALVAKLRAAERQLMSVRKNLQSKDLIATYKNPLGGQIQQILEEFGKRDYIVPDIFIEQVEKHINTFTRTSARSIIERSFQNKPYHRRLIEAELNRQGMPEPFFYLAMHESMLDSAIVSSAGARGLWQLMPTTARQFGLNVPVGWENLPIDEDQRTNPTVATQAGVKYLKLLYAEFGDVALAMAAYNAGEGRIRAALRTIDDPINNRDFWYIYRMGILTNETNQYVPKIIATMILDRNRARYGFPPDRS